MPARTIDIPELTKAVKFVVKQLLKRGYLHVPEDVQFTRPGYKLVHACGRANGPLSLDMIQLRCAVTKGNLWFSWYPETFLKLKLSKGTTVGQVEFNPEVDSLWEFVLFTLDRFK